MWKKIDRKDYKLIDGYSYAIFFYLNDESDFFYEGDG